MKKCKNCWWHKSRCSHDYYCWNNNFGFKSKKPDVPCKEYVHHILIKIEVGLACLGVALVPLAIGFLLVCSHL